MKSTRSTNRRGSCWVTISTSLHSEMMSFAPPLPGSRTRGRSMLPITLVLMFPYMSTWAAPRKP